MHITNKLFLLIVNILRLEIGKNNRPMISIVLSELREKPYYWKWQIKKYNRMNILNYKETQCNSIQILHENCEFLLDIGLLLSVNMLISTLFVHGKILRINYLLTISIHSINIFTAVTLKGNTWNSSMLVLKWQREKVFKRKQIRNIKRNFKNLNELPLWRW